MKKIAQFIIGAGCWYGVLKLGILTFTLLAAGQFFTLILAALFMVLLAIFAFLFFGEAID